MDFYSLGTSILIGALAPVLREGKEKLYGTSSSRDRGKKWKINNKNQHYKTSVF
jgi:hypothetical protein